jgi:hypothetical protein
LNNQLGLEYVQDIRRLFVYNSSFLTQNKMVSSLLTDCYKPFYFTKIASQPHYLPTSLENMHVFHGDNVIGPKEHWDGFINYLEVLQFLILMCFINVSSLLLRKFATNWFLGLPDNNINSLDAQVEMFSLIDGWKENIVYLF